MYTPGTILELKSPHEPDAETGEDFPYNRVEVVGPSPIDHGGARGGDWSGTEAAGVIIRPLTNFGSTLDEPFGKLQALYTVTEVPDVEVELNPRVRVINSATAQAGPTPEEVFAQEAPGTPPEEGQTRGRTKPNVESPLEDPRKPANSSPLDG